MLVAAGRERGQIGRDDRVLRGQASVVTVYGHASTSSSVGVPSSGGSVGVGLGLGGSSGSSARPPKSAGSRPENDVGPGTVDAPAWVARVRSASA